MAGGVPEVEGEDLGLAGQEVVLDAEAEHGFEVAMEDFGGDEVGDLGGFALAVLESVEGFEAELLAGGQLRWVFGVPLGDAGVEVPAVKVDALVGFEGFGEEFADLGEVHALEVGEADDDVGDLDAGVVDVVLDADLPAGFEGVGAEEACEGVAEDGVAEVADMGGLVGVDAGVLDEAEAGAAEVGVLVGGDAANDGGAFEVEVEVAGSGDFDAGDAGKGVGVEGFSKLGGEDAGGFAEALGELEGYGGGEFAEGDVRRLLKGQRGKIEVVAGEEEGVDAGFERLLDCTVHVR